MIEVSSIAIFISGERFRLISRCETSLAQHAVIRFKTKI